MLMVPAMASPDGMAAPPERAQAPRPSPPAEWWQHIPAASAPSAPPARPAPHAAATPSDWAAPHAATPYNPATAPTVVQRKPPVRPWWEQER